MAGELVVAELVAELRADGSEYLSTLGEIASETEITAAGMVTAFEGAAAGIAAAMGLVGIAAIKMYSDFDEQLTASTANLSGMNDEIKAKMADTALTLQTLGTSSAKEIAAAYGELATNGKNAAQALADIKVVDQFTIASHQEASAAARELAKAENAVGLAAVDAAQDAANMQVLADQITMGARMGSTSMSGLAEAVAQSGQQIKLLNGGVTEGIAILASYSKIGIDASQGAQQFNQVMRQLLTSTARNAQAWKDYGIQVMDTATGHLLPMTQILGEIGDKFKDMTQDEQNHMMIDLGFQTRVQQNVRNMIALTGTIGDYQTALQKAGGITEEVAKTQLATASAEAKTLMNALENVVTTIGQRMDPVTQSFAKTLIDLTAHFNDHSQAANDLAKFYQTGLADAFKLLIMLVGGLAIAFEAVIGDLKIVLEVVVKVYEAIKLLAIAFKDLSTIGFNDNFADTKKAFADLKDFNDTMGNSIAKTGDTIGRIFNSMTDFYGKFSIASYNAIEAQNKVFAAVTTTASGLDKFDATVISVNTHLSDGTPIVSRFANGVTEMEQLMKDLKAEHPWDGQTEKMEQYAIALATGRANLVQFSEAMQKIVGTKNPFSSMLEDNLAGQGHDDPLAKLKQQFAEEQQLYKAQHDALIAAAQKTGKDVTAIEKEYADAQANVTKQYALAKESIVVSNEQNIADSVTTIMADMFGKSSSLYKAAFAVDKAFAIAESIIKIQQAMASAAASAPFPEDLAAIAIVAAQGASIIGDITSVALSFEGGGTVPGIASMRSGGVDGSGGMMAIVHPGETINDPLNPNGGNGQPMNLSISIVNQHPSADVSAQQSSDGKTINILIKQVTQSIASRMRVGGDPISLAAEQTYGLKRTANNGVP